MEETFAPQRINDVAEAGGVDSRKTIENMIYARFYNSDHQILIVGKASKVDRSTEAITITTRSMESSSWT